MGECMKVRIKKCSNSVYWYADKIGDDYECDIEAVTHWQEITPPKD